MAAFYVIGSQFNYSHPSANHMLELSTPDARQHRALYGVRAVYVQES
jgi:hypothetical protein